MLVRKRDGSVEQADKRKILRCAERVCRGLSVDVCGMVDEAYVQLYDGVPTEQVDRSLVLAARARIASDPEYSYAAARLLLHGLYREAFGKRVDGRSFDHDYRRSFVGNVRRAVGAGLLSPGMVYAFDLDSLAKSIQPSRDSLLKYLGVQTLYDRYLLKDGGVRLETPQAFFMRVAMGLSLGEDDPTAAAAMSYELFSTLSVSHATPTLFNSGSVRSQLSSCFLSTLDDSIDGIFGSLHQQARLSKYAGGLGMDVTPLRASNSTIGGTKGQSQGLVPWLRLHNDLVLAVNQGGRRLGAEAVYCEVWHLDFPDFVELRKNTGDDRRRCHDLHTASWIPDLFMRRVQEGGDWYLFSPDDVPDLHDLYGPAFESAYVAYCDKADAGDIKNFLRVQAKDLWKKMLGAIRETGHPWMTFKDPCNIRYSDAHAGAVRSSNLCCVTGDQVVPTDMGMMTVSSLAELGTPLVVAGRSGAKNASRMAKTIENARVVVVKTEEGMTHRVTADHPLWLVDRGWVEAERLKPGDRVEIQSTHRLFGRVNEPELALLCGVVAGGGTFAGRSVVVCLYGDKAKLENEVVAATKASLTKHGFGGDVPAFRRSVAQGKLKMSSSALVTLMARFGFTKESKLRVPDFVWLGNEATVNAYLRGLFLMGGAVRAAESSVTSMSLRSVGETLLKQVQLLLLNIGVKSRVRMMRGACHRPPPDGVGGFKHYLCKPVYRLLVTSTKSCRALEAAVGLGSFRGHKQFLEKIAKGGCREKWWATVSSVDDDGREDVYCLMVDSEDRAWTCNGFITKNTEVLRHTKPTLYDEMRVVEVGETAVCTLASVNLAGHADDSGAVDYNRLAASIRKTVRNLDNAVDLNYYPTEEAKKSHLTYRPIGVGVMGWADLLHKAGLPFDSDAAVALAGDLQEFIAYHAILASSELAGERGAYPGYDGSSWSQGRLPQDTWEELMLTRGATARAAYKLDWGPVRESVRRHGMRNGNVMAIAPTATISSIVGCSQGIDPFYSVVFVYSTLSGEFTMVNESFVARLKQDGLWSPELMAKLKAADGDVNAPGLGLPLYIRMLYKTAFDVDQKKLVEAGAARQVWVDQGQSMNIFYRGNSMKELSDLYFHAWRLGCKTTYYLHSRAASRVEKSTQACEVCQ
jgi:ribonucleoside-diphosphate reductase alpha chain